LPDKIGLAFQWCVFIHILNDDDWKAAVANMRRARRYILYCDKINDNATVDYVKVRSVPEIIAEVESSEEFQLEKIGQFVGYTEDEFALLLFHRVRR
jgi:hypothetical protein